MVLKELLNLGYHPCCETSDRRHKLSPHGLISPCPHFSCLFRMKITMTLSPFLGLRQVFLAGTRVSSQKKGLISGKPVVDVVIRRFCKQGGRYCNRVGPAVLPLLTEEYLGRWLRGLMALQVGGGWLWWILCTPFSPTCNCPLEDLFLEGLSVKCSGIKKGRGKLVSLRRVCRPVLMCPGMKVTGEQYSLMRFTPQIHGDLVSFTLFILHCLPSWLH